MHSREVIKRLQAEGWVQVRVTGSHHHFAKKGENLIVTVPHPNRDLKIGTLRNIERASKVRLR